MPKEVLIVETELNEPQVVRFLLDELSEEERTPIEEQLVLDPAYYEAVCAIEDELLRDYLHGKLLFFFS